MEDRVHDNIIFTLDKIVIIEYQSDDDIRPRKKILVSTTSYEKIGSVSRDESNFSCNYYDVLSLNVSKENI